MEFFVVLIVFWASLGRICAVRECEIVMALEGYSLLVCKIFYFIISNFYSKIDSTKLASQIITEHIETIYFDPPGAILSL